MKNLYDNFLKTLREKIPQKAKLATTLSEILFIEKEAVYRRLRGEVAFTFAEVATISHQLGISIDFIVGTVTHRSRPLHLKIMDYIDTEEIDFEMQQKFLSLIESAVHLEGTEYASAMNIISSSLYMNYKHLCKFYIFKWKYQQEITSKRITYQNIVPTEKLYLMMKEIPRIARLARETCYIWDDRIFQTVVDDISYFYEVNLITNEEKELIKKDLNDLLDEVEQLAIKGEFSPGRKVHFYISNIHFEASYVYIDSIHTRTTVLKAFTMYEISSSDPVLFDITKNWFQSLKRTSTLISESGEMQRILFFEKQRAIINTL